MGTHGVVAKMFTRGVTSACRHGHQRSRKMATSSKILMGAQTSPSARTDEDKYVVESLIPKVPLSGMDVTQRVLGHVHKYGHKTAIECGITGRSYTYNQLIDATYRWGAALERLTGGQKTTVAIYSPNTPEYPIISFGVTAVGYIGTSINAAYTPEEVTNQLLDSGATVLVVDPILEPFAQMAVAATGRNIKMVVNGPSQSGCPNLQELINDTTAPFAKQTQPSPESIAVLPYSSGTTGNPKGVALSHSAVSGSMEIFHNSQTVHLKPADGDHQDILIGLLPFFHIYGMCCVMGAGLYNGAKIITLPCFDPELYVDTLKSHRPTVLHTVPSLVKFIAASPLITSAELESVHTVMCGAAPVPPTAASVLKQKTSNPIFFQEGFGMTETLCTHMTPLGGERLGSSGILMPHIRAKVIDLNTGEALPPDVPGELCIQSPTNMTRYHGNEKATLETIDEDGWLHTGDVATYGEDGYFSIVDRIKELIKVKGLQVSPSELEELLLQHPAVLDVGIIGVEDDRAGEVPRAYVVAKDKVSAEELHAFLNPRIAKHKQLLGGIQFIDELPKNPTGKIMKKELKVMANEQS
ncbi:unnamed protein product, partial [Meganyctiphanes norvegica]